MNPLCNLTTDILLPLKPSSSSSSSLLLLNRPKLQTNPRFPNTVTLIKPSSHSNPLQWRISCSTENPTSSSASITEVDMFKDSEGVWSAKQKKVVVLWDLDNKPPRGPPYQAAMALKKVDP